MTETFELRIQPKIDFDTLEIGDKTFTTEQIADVIEYLAKKANQEKYAEERDNLYYEYKEKKRRERPSVPCFKCSGTGVTLERCGPFEKRTTTCPHCYGTGRN